MQAGDAAVARYASIEARARFQEALDLSRSLPPSENAWRAQIEAVLKLASVAQNRTHFEQDLRNLEQAFALAEAINDRESLCRHPVLDGPDQLRLRPLRPRASSSPARRC